jgi:uncharacterized cysteine cluster protein YcgN (CxxCxxCC family)
LKRSSIKAHSQNYFSHGRTRELKNFISLGIGFLPKDLAYRKTLNGKTLVTLKEITSADKQSFGITE